MDWPNERYVRLYVRDTTTWKRLGWDGQCVLMQLLRKVDRAGTLDLSELEPWEAVALHTGASEDVARRGVEALLRTRTAVISGGRLMFPSFVEAQECSKTDKQRQKESRDRRAIPVTERDEASRNVTDPSQPVTAGHEQSQPVTSCHSVLCSAVLSSAVQNPPGDAGARDVMQSLSDSAVHPTVDVMGLQLAVGKAADELGWETAPEVTPSQLARAAKRVPRLAERRGVTRGEAALLLARAALQSARATGKGVGFALLEVDPAQPPPRARGRPGMAPATTHLDFADAEPIETQLARLREDHG